MDCIKHEKHISVFKNKQECYRNYTPVEIAINFIEICIDNKKYDFVYIGYHKLNEGFLFSKLLNFNELKEWHKIKN